MNKQLSFADAFSAELQSEIQRCDGIPTGDAFKLATLKAFKMSAGSALEEALCLMRKIKKPVLMGEINNYCETVVDVGPVQLQECEALLREQGGVAVCDRKFEGESVVEFILSIKLEKSDIWLRLVIPPFAYRAAQGECLDDLDEEESDWSPGPSIDPDKVVEAALWIVCEDGFGRLKNRDQRQDFIENELRTKDYEGDLLYFVQEILFKAEMIFDQVVLPLRVQRMASEGLTSNQIANKLGLSKGRIDKAKMAVVAQNYVDRILAENIPV